MNLEYLPGRVLLCVGCIISGFMLAAWCLPMIENKPRVHDQKPGFSITFPTSILRNPAETYKLIGKQVRLVRTPGSPNESCVIDHAPLTLQIHDQFVILSGGFERLENLVIHASLIDLKAPELAEFQGPASLKLCRAHPRVTYGE